MRSTYGRLSPIGGLVDEPDQASARRGRALRWSRSQWRCLANQHGGRGRREAQRDAKEKVLPGGNCKVAPCNRVSRRSPQHLVA